jgi:hypothetical protein|tara:strand:- start:964 stop:1386 length:423 start_codon:yes stop_codon:yes gene_type:complete
MSSILNSKPKNEKRAGRNTGFFFLYCFYSLGILSRKALSILGKSFSLSGLIKDILILFLSHRLSFRLFPFLIMADLSALPRAKSCYLLVLLAGGFEAGYIWLVFVFAKHYPASKKINTSLSFFSFRLIISYFQQDLQGIY